MTDAELRALARAERDDTLRSIDADADLAVVRGRIADGRGQTMSVGRSTPHPRRWPLTVAAAAVIALVATGAVVVLRTDGEAPAIRTNTPEPTTAMTLADTLPAPTTVPSPYPSTAVETSTSTESTSLPATPTSLLPATSAPPAPVPALPPAGDPEDALAISHRCAPDGACTQLVTADDGSIVAYDPVDHTVARLDATGAEVLDVIEVDQAIRDRRPRLVAAGPDGVTYFLVASVGTTDAFVDLVAIATTGAGAGSAIEIGTGLDGSGDTDLVATAEGLAEVGCCRTPGAFVLPSPDATVHRWVDSEGSTTTSDAPTFAIELGESSGLTRSDPATGTVTAFELPAVAVDARGMPPVVATDDGGAVMLVFDQLSLRRYAIRFRPDWPEFDIEPSDVVLLPEEADSSIVLVEAAGTVVVGEGGRLVRRTFENVGTAGWPGRLQTDPTDPWASMASGLNDLIASNQPEWATDPLLLARQLQPRLGPNEHRSATWDETSGVLTITTSGFLDDSVLASRDEIVLELGSDGLYRFVSGTRAQQCQPGRGQQDFRPQPCT